MYYLCDNVGSQPISKEAYLVGIRHSHNSWIIGDFVYHDIGGGNVLVKINVELY